MFRLSGVVQHYNWGGSSFIPSLIGFQNIEGKPCAEYWMGAHSKAPSIVVKSNNAAITLDKWIEEAPSLILGEKVYQQFGSLPYLLKVLDVKDMLSIQVHPSKTAAKLGFEAEESAGVPIEAPHRNYKDKNHKPELMYALSEFWLLHGFKSIQKIKNSIANNVELFSLQPYLENGGFKAVYEYVMQLPQSEVNSILKPLIDRILPLYEQGQLTKDQEAFWAARAYKTFCTPNWYDRGLFSIYLFNIVHLNPGEAIFQGQGMLHAYLEGQNIELMANSDNVLRGGLTNKHIDVEELLKHVVFDETLPRVLSTHKDVQSGETVYETPAEDFELRSLALELGDQANVISYTVEIWIIIKGLVELEGLTGSNHLNKGQCFLTAANERITIRAKEPSLLFKATVPYSQPVNK
ncbi:MULTISPECIES: mannose-6-phosphate isomerase, class I [unclassified Paraflavitalea]|uniref:mannose-6-phosphate isomerase, class I n=1 Tax=unclassified Paraflavitalea TaxID=2798305 RepID=UPI003D34B273